MKFRVFEVQEETVWRRWAYEIEAATPEEAMEKAENGEHGEGCGPHDHGCHGDSDFGASGWSLMIDGDERVFVPKGDGVVSIGLGAVTGIFDEWGAAAEQLATAIP